MHIYLLLCPPIILILTVSVLHRFYIIHGSEDKKKRIKLNYEFTQMRNQDNEYIVAYIANPNDTNILCLHH